MCREEACVSGVEGKESAKRLLNECTKTADISQLEEDESGLK